MIPIEELKPCSRMWTLTKYCDFWWYLLRNWNKRHQCNVSCAKSFWWYLLRNWNPKMSAESLMFSQTFWWYLLRNWNCLLLTDRQQKPWSFDDTYWGIETAVSLGLDGFHGLLMIPIEELKHVFANIIPRLSDTFDDTYWGIETNSACGPASLCNVILYN